LTLISPDEWLLMADVERLIGQTFPREVIPGFEAFGPAAPAADRARRNGEAGAIASPPARRD